MSKTFVKREYRCNSCQVTNVELLAFAKHHEIFSYFTKDMLPETISETKVYREELIRDEMGIIIKRQVVECLCSKCGSSDTTAVTKMNMEPVLNFYPPCDAQRWSDGFAKAGL